MAKEQTPETGNLYSRLGINRGATDEQVRTAYYRLVQEFHPDRRKGGERDEETFKGIVRAAAILRDPAMRKLYDRGAIDEFGVLAGSSGRWPRWSYRELALACVVTALTVLVSGAAFYSLDKSGGAFQPVAAPAGHKEKSLLPAGPVSHEVSFAQPAEQSKAPAPTLLIDDNPAELFKALQKQRAVYSPRPAADNRAEIDSTAAAAAANGGDRAVQKYPIILKKPDAPKQRSKIPLSSNVIIIPPSPRRNPQKRSECSLTSAAREILAEIIAR